MSDPTYRIDVEHDAAEVLSEAARRIRNLDAQHPPFSVYVDDDGQPVEAHSVKA